jgi:L-aminopeptidase/D-esterase-like protein
MSGTLTDVPGIQVGHWTDADGQTGCTVVVLPEPNVTAVEIRGGAPGSRETALLAPGMRVEQVHAILLTGGSAFGLAAADGVMSELEAQGRGHETPAGVVPIVPAAVIFDLANGDASARPGPEQGQAAFLAASSDPVQLGSVGVGTGASVGAWRGFDQRKQGGLGSFAVRYGDLVVAALVVVNAVGDVFSLEGVPLTGGPHVPSPPPEMPSPSEHTTLSVLATNGRFSRAELSRLALRGQDAYSACIRPVHTRFDGDACFAVSCGGVESDVDLAAELAFQAVGRAIESAIPSGT